MPSAPGKTSTVDVVVDVTAVTDRVDLSWIPLATAGDARNSFVTPGGGVVGLIRKMVR